MKILLVGALGRMGRAISLECLNNAAVIVAGVDRSSNSNDKYDFPIYQNINSVKESCDVIIDFSHHSMIKEVSLYAKEKNLPVVFGATGIEDMENDIINELSYHVPVLQSANMSLGVQLMRILSKKAAKILRENYDIEIIEKHHNQKKDAPSGTALLLYNDIKEENNFPIYGREGDSLRDVNEIGIHSLRGGTLPGEHEVAFLGEYDDISIIHRARDRKVFAQGAIKMAKAIMNKSNGRYDTYDIVKEILGD